MRLQELFETTEEDRALISLSSSIYNKVKAYSNTDLDYDDESDESLRLGKIGELFNTPISILDNINLELQGGEPFLIRARVDLSKHASSTQVYGLWEPETQSIILNIDYLDTEKVKTVITHELRHALDDYKSKFKTADDDTRYTTPKKREQRKDPESMLYYKSRPDEINARFLEALDILVKRIPKWYNRLQPGEIKRQVSIDFINLLSKYEIAELFPEKTKSADYKRLVKRGYDTIQKEMKYVELQTGKIATGSW